MVKFNSKTPLRVCDSWFFVLTLHSNFDKIFRLNNRFSMKRMRLFLMVFAAMAVVASPSVAQEQVEASAVATQNGPMMLTLDKALEIALADNPTIKVADQEIQLKKVANKEAWQTLLPEVSLSGSWQHTIKAPEMKLNGMSFRMGDDGVNTAAAVATLSLPVFAPKRANGCWMSF